MCKQIKKMDNGFVVVKGNYLEWYNENDDILECPYLHFEGLQIETIDDEEIWFEPISETWKIQILDGIGNVEEELNSIITITEWSQEALLNKSKMTLDLGYISDNSDVIADFVPYSIEFELEENNEFDTITAYGLYKIVFNHETEKQIEGEVVIELRDYIQYNNKLKIDDIVHKEWGNFIIEDPNVLDFIENNI